MFDKIFRKFGGKEEKKEEKEIDETIDVTEESQGNTENEHEDAEASIKNMALGDVLQKYGPGENFDAVNGLESIKNEIIRNMIGDIMKEKQYMKASDAQYMATDMWYKRFNQDFEELMKIKDDSLDQAA